MKLKMPEGLKEIHVFVEKNKFPIAVFLCNDWEKTQLEYIDPNENTSESLCDWCDAHHVKYQVLYPSVAKSIIRNPFMYRKYMKMINNMCRE